MTAVTTYDGLLARVSGKNWVRYPLFEFQAAAGVAFGGNGQGLVRAGRIITLPSPVAGNSSYIPTFIDHNCTVNTGATYFVARLINLGSLDIATPTFTDGSSMPTVTEAGTSRTTNGGVLIEVTTALSGTPGNFTFTYVDQDGNSAEATTSLALPASGTVGSCGWGVLNSTDVGVRDITTATRTGGSTPTGVIKFWGVIPIAMIQKTTIGNLNGVANLITSEGIVQRIPAAATIGVFTNNTAAKGNTGSIFFVGDS